MTKYQNKYRIASARAPWWDYGWSGAYFITICTENRNYYLGDIHDGKMVLSRLGVIVDILWHEIPYHSQNIELGDFVVMPNHIHGILILNNPVAVQTGHALSQSRFQNIGKNTISSIIGSYKSAVTKHANRMGIENGWQTRFHDHIIRDDISYQRISDYIISNVEKWENDKFNSTNLLL